jgi:hypothetical protein
LVEKKFEDLPGPGQYELKSNLEGPQYTMYERRDQKIEHTPGPGEYYSEKKEMKGLTIGQRYKDKKFEDLPGPGQYEGSPSTLQKKGFKIGARLSTKIEEKPGPGQYNGDTLKLKSRPQTAAVFSKSKTKRSKKVDEDDIEPGPGHYRYYNPKLAGKGVSFTKDRKNKFNSTYTPGPGSYGGLNCWAPGYGYEW